MDKYEYRVKTEQMLDHLEKKEYHQAKEIADGIDWRRVKNASMLNTVSEIYEYNGEFKKGRDILFLAFDRAPGSSVGLPVCSEPVPGGFDAGPEFKTLDNIARGARIACEIGCDFMKVGYAPGFERIVDETFVPLVVLGGAKTDNEKEFLASIKNAMDAGASGVAIGRNVWGGGNTVNMTRALAAIIHKDASVDEAYAILKGEK